MARSNTPRAQLRKKAMLELMRRNQEEGLPSPSIRELADAAGISSTSVTNYHLHRLAAEGLITITPGISRGAVLSQQGNDQGHETEPNPILRIPFRGILRDHRIVWVAPEVE